MDQFKNLAIEVIKEAGESIQQLAGHADYSMKNAHDILSEADLASEKIIISRIKERYPDHSFLAEESGEDPKKSEFLWIIDPVDGTINYSRGIEEYCISIALCQKGEIILGVIFQPSLNKLYVAERGKGSFLNDQKISVSSEKDLINTIGATDNSSNIEARINAFESLVKLADEVRQVRIFGSGALHLAKIAEGKIDFYYKPKFNYWDYAAGIILVKEAGGKITDFDGNTCNKDSKTIIASNGLVHAEVLKYIK